MTCSNPRHTGINRSTFSFTICFLFCIGFGLLLNSCSLKDPKFSQYYAQGEQLYVKNCSNCHQKDGNGLGLLYPPLRASDYMNKNQDEVMCLMKHGMSGEIVVNGKIFNKPMPGIPALTDLEIAEIATYIYNTWGNQHGLIDVKQASEVINRCHP